VGQHRDDLDAERRIDSVGLRLCLCGDRSLHNGWHRPLAVWVGRNCLLDCVGVTRRAREDIPLNIRDMDSTTRWAIAGFIVVVILALVLAAYGYLSGAWNAL
jgi:hypothetical protein